ncbi:MAG: SWIM zinc finger family protein [Proteobacteria bacterium]|nr:SWIM zinc finger family protein [Pseudomonadota bacterium]
MAWGYRGRWPDYVSVAERRKTAERQLKKLRKNGQSVSPVTIEGRKIARTFWGKAWCDNLEGYRDYENRLPRGRTYVRNGLVVDLQITALEIKALVSGSSVYKVVVTIKALAPSLWRSICTDCAGGIDSLVELLQGRFSNGVMERLCRQERGLFPKPSEIRFSCTCPDGAYMCKHVAAALYGVGARLDERPELLFQLRAVDENELVAGLDEGTPFSNQQPDVEKILETDDISALFGLDIEDAGNTISASGTTPTAPVLAERPGRYRPDKKTAGRKTVGATRPAVADGKAQKDIAQPPVVSDTTSSKRNSNSRTVGKTTRASNSGDPTKRAPSPVAAKPRAGSKGGKGTKKRKAPKRQFELTPDGFVKWWK